MNIIECRKIGDDLFELSFTLVKKDNTFVKFNEGHFKTKDECLIACVKKAKDHILNGLSFEFFINV